MVHKYLICYVVEFSNSKSYGNKFIYASEYESAYNQFYNKYVDVNGGETYILNIIDFGLISKVGINKKS